MSNLPKVTDQTEEKQTGDVGITLEQLRRRPLAQKLSDLDALDWRSYVPSESRKVDKRKDKPKNGS